jgi:hypothetical protein
MPGEWDERHFERVRSTVLAPDDVARALRGFCVDVDVLIGGIKNGPYAGMGSAHVCVAHAGLAFRVCRVGNGHHNKEALDEMICELRYAQIAHTIGVGLRSCFFGIVQLGETEKLVSCWPLGARISVPRTEDTAACTALRTELRARLELLATRLVALDACKPANWVVVDGALFAIDFETHMCFEAKTDAQREASVRFVPVLLALFEMHTAFRFATGVCVEPTSHEELAEMLHSVTRALVESFSGAYESFEGVRYGQDDVVYGLLCIFLAYTASCLRAIGGAQSTVSLLVGMRAALEEQTHEHHSYARDTYTSCEVLAPFTKLAASLVDGTRDRPTRGDAIRTFHEAASSGWRPVACKKRPHD